MRIGPVYLSTGDSPFVFYALPFLAVPDRFGHQPPPLRCLRVLTLPRGPQRAHKPIALLLKEPMALIGKLQDRYVNRFGEPTEGEQELDRRLAGEFLEFHSDELAEFCCCSLIVTVAHRPYPTSPPTALATRF